MQSRGETDDFGCLKTLIDGVVKRQNDTMESIEELARRTDKVSSDISNLINSLQMVGNRQFAENRIREDDSMMGGLMKNGSSTPVKHQDNPKEQLTLTSILLRAIGLVPDTDEDVGDHISDHKVDRVQVSENFDVAEECSAEPVISNRLDPIENRTSQDPKQSPILERLLDVPSVCESTITTTEASTDNTTRIQNNIGDAKTGTTQAQPRLVLPPLPVQHLPPEEIVSKVYPQGQSRPTKPQRTEQIAGEEQTKPVIESRTKPQPAKISVDRDRIADILKRYSLYDEDDEEDEDVESD